MRPRALLFFVVLNALVTLGVSFAVFSALSGREDNSTLPQYQTVMVIITATRDPNATEAVRIITATPRPNEIANLPTGVLDSSNPNATEPASRAAAAPTNTLDPAVLEANPELAETLTVLPAGCILHALEAGENPSILAQEFGTSVNLILLVNSLSEADASLLQIGQQLIIPLDGCPLGTPPPTATDTPDFTAAPPTNTPDLTATTAAQLTENAPTATPSVTATITLPPTATNAQIEIVQVTTPGDITAESVVIRNNGRTVNVTGWTLTDLEGNMFTFGERNLFSDAEITVFTRAGTNTPVAAFWGRDTAMWGEPGDVVTLADANGIVQAVYRVPSNG